MTGDCVGQGPRKPAWPHSKLDRLELNGWPKSLPIWILLVTMTLIAGCANIDAPVDGCEWIRLIILDEDDRLTTGTKRVVLAHNEAWSEFCKSPD